MSCPPDKIVTSDGFVVCSENGIVLDVVYDHSPPKVYKPEDRTRVSSSLTNPILHDYGIHTDIDVRPSREATAERVSRVKRLRSLNTMLRVSTSARRHVSVIKVAREALSKLGALSLLPDVASLLRQVGQCVGCKNSRVLAATLVYIACRIREVPRTLQDVADATGLDRNDVWQCFRNLVGKLNLRLPPYSPAMFVPRVASTLKLPGDVTTLAETLVNIVRDRCNEFQGNDPLGVAAGAVYIASVMKGRRVPQSVIAKKIGVSEMTVRTRYREVVNCLKRLGFDVPKP